MTKKKKKSRIYIIWIVNLCLITAVVAFFVWYESVPDVSPEKVLKTYMAHISNREYEQMYEMIDAGISGNIKESLHTNLYVPFSCINDTLFSKVTFPATVSIDVS